MIPKKVPGWLLLTPKAFIFDPDSPDPLDQLEPEMFQVCCSMVEKTTRNCDLIMMLDSDRPTVSVKIHGHDASHATWFGLTGPMTMG